MEQGLKYLGTFAILKTYLSVAKEGSVKASWRRWGREGERKYVVCCPRPYAEPPSRFPGSHADHRPQSRGPVFRAHRQRPDLSAASRPALCSEPPVSSLASVPAQGGTVFRTGNCRTESLSAVPTSSSREAQSWVSSRSPRWARLSARPSESLRVCTPHLSFQPCPRGWGTAGHADLAWPLLACLHARDRS